jgi:hypothetical protein
MCQQDYSIWYRFSYNTIWYLRTYIPVFLTRFLTSCFFTVTFHGRLWHLAFDRPPLLYRGRRNVQSC